MKIYIFSFIFLLCGLSSKSQLFQDFDHHISYFGVNAINPGLKYNVETPWYDSNYSDKLLLPFGRTKLSWEAFVAYNWDPFSHSAFFNGIDLSYKQYLGSYIGIQASAGIGYAILTTQDNFVFDENGIEQRQLLSHWYAAPQISLGGFIGGRRQNRKLFTKLNLQLLMPYNILALPLFSLELGYQF